MVKTSQPRTTVPVSVTIDLALVHADLSHSAGGASSSDRTTGAAISAVTHEELLGRAGPPGHHAQRYLALYAVLDCEYGSRAFNGCEEQPLVLDCFKQFVEPVLHVLQVLGVQSSDVLEKRVVWK